MPDAFGDLNQWNGVLAKLDEIASRASLDEHQVGLARILRFRQNRSLVHAALEYAGTIERPSEILIAEVLNVLVSRDFPVPTKTLAARVLGRLICRYPVEAVSDFDVNKVIESMSHVLSRAESPPLRRELCRAISSVRSQRNKVPRY